MRGVHFTAGRLTHSHWGEWFQHSRLPSALNRLEHAWTNGPPMPHFIKSLLKHMWTTLQTFLINRTNLGRNIHSGTPRPWVRGHHSSSALKSALAWTCLPVQYESFTAAPRLLANTLLCSRTPPSNPEPAAQEYTMILTPEVHAETRCYVVKEALHTVHPFGRAWC